MTERPQNERTPLAEASCLEGLLVILRLGFVNRQVCGRAGNSATVLGKP